MSDNLPKEIVQDILSRLSVKSVLRLRCVCKLWREYISDTGFIDLHYNRSKEKGNMNIVGNIRINWSTDTCLVDPCCGTLVDLGYSLEGRIMGCCNGLICIHEPHWKKRKVTLFNPSTRQHMTSIYPYFNPYFNPHDDLDTNPRLHLWAIGAHGFGYDQTLNSYKIVELDSDRHLNAYVYTFSTNQWRHTHKSIPYYVPVSYNPGIFVNGALYWHATSKIHHLLNQDVILAFDCVKEEFSEMPLPVTPGCPHWKYSFLADFRGHLSDINIVTNSHVDVWVMMGSSWTKLFKFSTSCALPSSHYFAWYSILPVPAPPSTLAAWLLKVQNNNPNLLDQNGTRWSITRTCFDLCICLDTLTSLDTLNWKIGSTALNDPPPDVRMAYARERRRRIFQRSQVSVNY